MAVVLKLVGEVASEEKHSVLFHVPAANEHYIVALEEDPSRWRVLYERVIQSYPLSLRVIFYNNLK